MSEGEYTVYRGDPYLTKDMNGAYVILQDETIRSDTNEQMVYHNQILVNPNPTNKEIFKYKLKGDVKENMFVGGRLLAGN